jgi:transposase
MSQHHHDVTAAIDIGDRYSHLCLLDTESGEVIEEGRILTNHSAFQQRFSGPKPMRIAIETGTHSPWISRMLQEGGHEVLVAHARKVRLIYGEGRKNDKLDAEKLARLARVDPKLLSPLEHRGEASQAHLALIRSRDALVSARTKSSSTTSAERSSRLGLLCPSALRRAFTRR